ncbi:cytochrome C oxidase subunit IV family protein [Roseibium sp. M-1]
MTSRPLVCAWLALMGLSIATVLVTSVSADLFSRSLFGGLLLFLAWAKARIILSRFLGLWQAPAWLSGFSWVIGLYCLLLLCLYLVPAITV